MKLLVALGNPGQQYALTRHNFGFFVAEHLATSHNTTWQAKSKLRAQIAQFQQDGQTVLLCKPATFYNLSGEAVRATLLYFALSPEDVLVLHDDLALPFGTVRARIGGSSAGNNGIKSISSHIGEEYARLRLGIANDVSANTPAEQFVLQRFTVAERNTLPNIAILAGQLIDDFVHEDKQFTHTSLKIE